MLSANQTVLLNEIKKKQGRPIFALCRACGLAPADGAKAKLELIQLGMITEHNASSGLYVIMKGLPEKPVARPKPVENPYQILRRNEPSKVQAEQNGLLTSEAKRQRAEIARLEEVEREETPAFVMPKPEPIKEKSIVEQIAEELRWHEQFDREQEELAEQAEAEEQAEQEFVEEPEAEDADVPDEEIETESEEEEMANLSPTALAVLEKARVAVNGAEDAKIEVAPKTIVDERPYGKALPVPTSPNGKPIVTDDMIVAYLTEFGPNTMGMITAYFGRQGSGLATKLSKMVKNKIIAQREKVQGQLIVYLTNADYLKEIGKTLAEQKIPVVARPHNVERGTMLATREQVSAVEVEKPATLATSGEGTTKSNLPDLIKEQVKDLPQESFFEVFKAPVVETAPVEPTLKSPEGSSGYAMLTEEQKRIYVIREILRHLESGPKDVILLAIEMPTIPVGDIHSACLSLNQRRKIVKCQPDEIPEGYEQSKKKYSVWKLVPADVRVKRRIEPDEVLALFTDAETILTITTIAETFGRTASGLGATLNALCKLRKLVKCGDAPARYRLANATLSSILEEIEKSFTVKNKEDKPEEDWLPVLKRLEDLIGGNAGQVLADIQAYLTRRLKDD